ncbi:uncharacterized protein LOC134263483 [Saccostrea cucullata]|uniref:uncharacterized protein LOC134263483 n=1 Tax=Saccostrea cuccullata TaxID=36930 RepID=UPI002ED0CDA7
MGCKETEKVSLICVQMDQDTESESTSGSTAMVRTSTVDSSPEKSKLTSDSTQSVQTIIQATERAFTGKQNTTTDSMMDQYKDKKSSSLPTDMVRTSIMQDKSQPTSKSTQTSTTQSMKVTSESSSSGKPNTTTVSMTYSLTNTTDIIETITPIPTRERTTLVGMHSNDNDEASKTTIPISIAAVIGGIFLVLIFIYLCYWKKRHQTGIQTKKSKHEQIKVSNVAGIVNAAYFTIELKEQGIISSDMEEKIENLYTQADNETYHHLREKDSSKKKFDNECNYDTTKNAIEKTEKYIHYSEGTYDRLGDKRCNTIADDTYHHACTVQKDRSDYDVTEVRKKYILDSPYNHFEIIPNENDTEQDMISNLSETQNEEHTYFILEQD